MDILLKCVENVLERGYAYRNGIFWVLGVVFIAVVVWGVFAVGENKRYIANKLALNAFTAIIVMGVGGFLYLLGISFETEYRYFNGVIFVLAVGFVVIYGLFLSVMFKDRKAAVLQVCKYTEYIIFFELFWLAFKNCLEWQEAVLGILAVMAFEMIIMLMKKPKEKQKDERRKVSDYPCAELYYTRQKQLEKFVPILKQQEAEPYAIMISGEWGMGKSSFIMALEKAMQDSTFIWVRAGSEKNVSEIMLEISEQILDVLKKNHIYIEKEGLIEKYFLAFTGAIEETKLSTWSKLIDMLGINNTREDSESYLKSKLKELQQTIYLIIDDLDRCDREYQLKMFKVIRESTKLENCKTIFLVDKQMFLAGDCDINYIEKYVNYTLDLCQVKYAEIVNFFIEDIFDDDCIQKLPHALLQGRTADVIRSLICDFPLNIMEVLSYAIEDAKRALVSVSEKQRAEEKAKLEDLEQTVLKLQKNTANSRKVKNYLKGIKTDLAKLGSGIELCGKEYLKEDWIKTIVEVRLIKCFLPEEFWDIQMSTDLYEYFKKKQGYALRYILDLKDGGGVTPVIKREILGYVIYEMDTIKFSELKTRKEKCLAELRTEEAQFNHIVEYAKYAESYTDYEKIMKLYDERPFKNETDKENFIKAMLSRISEVNHFTKADTPEFMELSRSLVEVLKRNGLSQKQKSMCIAEKERIMQKVILDNAQVFKNILYIFFNINLVEQSWNNYSVSDIDEFYRLLKGLDRNGRFWGLEESPNRLSGIESYYKRMEKELEKAQYASIKIDFKERFAKIRNALQICRFWNNMEMALEDNENTPLFEKYFTLGTIYHHTGEAFADNAGLYEALEVLGEFYDAKADAYDARYTLLLERLLYHFLGIYEGNALRFSVGSVSLEDIIRKMDELVEKVHHLDLSENGTIIDRIEIWRFQIKKIYSENMRRTKE